MGFDLSQAKLCMDCNWVDAYQVCPKCGSKAIFPISRFINRVAENYKQFMDLDTSDAIDGHLFKELTL